MGDQPADSSREAVAYQLFISCLIAANNAAHGRPKSGMAEADILNLYGRCLACVSGVSNTPHQQGIKS